ncbi:uncharacterized protein N7496_000166 [Penicillium cataractarum]|uniref:Uncharacterized protein n=1 Tax=Penicillium cataractarum TaxID=2100454 RepID=A0A9W9VTK8_9EURO|nr:uncharacterized protein N7496_000166 [Penicillium cataractarum]KAJ5389098.1 hypothetical protein N7496_000166 [Penicillium cataractarum]
MLEQQQRRLVRGLLELYHRTAEGRGWLGDPLELQANGHPLTHALLARLGVLNDIDDSCIEQSPGLTPLERCGDDIQCQILTTEGTEDSTVQGDQSPLSSWCLQATSPFLPTDTQQSSKRESMPPAIYSSTSIEESDYFLIQDGAAQWPLITPADIYNSNNLTADVGCSGLDFYESLSQPIFDKMMPEYNVLLDNLSFGQNLSARPMGPTFT